MAGKCVHKGQQGTNCALESYHSGREEVLGHQIIMYQETRAILFASDIYLIK